MALAHCGFPFSIGRSVSPVGRFRALARRSRNAGSRLRLLGSIVMTLGWPVAAFTTALRTRTRLQAHGEPHGVATVLDMYWLALRHSIPPLEYGLYCLNDPARRAVMHDYVYWNDLPGLAALNNSRGADNRDVQDKGRFADICAQHGLPHVSTLAIFADGRQLHPHAPFAPEAPVLWVKARRLKGGAGAAKWTRAGSSYCDGDGRCVAAAAFAGHLRAQDCIVQSFVENHPTVAQTSNGALGALRIVTGISRSGEAMLVTALMSLPHGAQITSVAGILCSIDPATGRIGHAATPGGTPVIHHPDTGVKLPGIVLPFWAESVALVLRAHAQVFTRFVFLGWDVALTREGPVLLEANSGWGALFHQTLDGPLGQTAFATVANDYV